MSEKLCKDNVICCDDNCQRCANLIYNKYVEQQAEISKLKKSNRNWRRKVQRLKMKLGIKDLEYSCLERERADDIGEFVEELKSLKIKAYKECIEKIKAESSSCVATDHGIVVAGSRTYTISEVKLYEIEKELENNNAK